MRADRAWDVPGYDVHELLGFGTAGEVWRARHRSSGATVALRRVEGGNRGAVAQIRAQATVVRSLPTGHLVRLRTTTRAGRDDVLVLDDATGGSLASLLLRRGSLQPGEVVTVLAPLAQALGQAHEHDLVHGRVSATTVLLTAEGKPLLDGLGLSSLYDADDSHDPTGGLGSSADVWALGALGRLLLTGAAPDSAPVGALGSLAPRAPLPLVQALEAALAFDATTRPSARDLAAALLASCPALPIEGIVAASDPVPGGRRWVGVVAGLAALRVGAPTRRLLVGAGGLAALALVIGVGWAWGRQIADRPAFVQAAGIRSVPRPFDSRTATTVGATGWSEVLQRLDSIRARAFSQADARLLSDVYAADSAALATDAAAIRGLAQARRTAVGVEHEVHKVVPVQLADDRVELRVQEVLGAFTVRDAAGAVLDAQPATRLVTHSVVLVRAHRGWVIGEVRLA